VRPSTGSDSLYDRYVAAKREHGEEVSLDRERFERQLAEKQEKLKAQLGRDVRFEVMVDDGKVKLAARKERKAGRRE
jgi:flavin-dependent dehydrogenase